MMAAAGKVPMRQRPGGFKPAPKPRPAQPGRPAPGPVGSPGGPAPSPKGRPRYGPRGASASKRAPRGPYFSAFLWAFLLGSACGGAAELSPGLPEILPSSRAVLVQDGAELTAWHVIDLWLPVGDAGLGLPLTVEIIVDSGSAEWRCQVSAPWLVVPIEVRLPMSGGAAPGPAGTARLE